MCFMEMGLFDGILAMRFRERACWFGGMGRSGGLLGWWCGAVGEGEWLCLVASSSGDKGNCCCNGGKRLSNG